MHAYETPAISPTCYLTHAQREQLKKSTRKLAKILGATPMLRVSPPSSRRGSQEDISTNNLPVIDIPIQHATISAPTSPLPDVNWTLADANARAAVLRRAPQLRFESTEPCHNTGLRALSSPQALFAFPSATFAQSPVSSGVVASPRSSTLITPSSTTARRISFSPLTPVSAREEMEIVRRLQRKRLSKLARTLGQTVPPVLVAPPRRSVTRQRSVRNRRSLYISLRAAAGSPRISTYSTSTLDEVEEQQEDEPTPASTVYAALPEIWQAVHAHHAEEPHDDDAIEEGKSDVLVIEPNMEIGELEEPPRSARPRTRPFSMEIHSPTIALPARARSEDAPARQPLVLERDEDEDDKMDEDERARIRAELPPRSGSRIAQIFQRKVQAHDENERTGPVAHRSERRQGWSGEWNAASVQDVIAKLRELK